MIQRGLVLIALGCCALVLASFAMFARDQISNASIHQQTELATGRTPAAGPPPPAHHAQPRRFIDDAARTLTSPFRSIVESKSEWVVKGVPTLLAIVLYGGGLGFLARYSRGMV